ncbi:MAG: hypothetical protein QOD59_4620 [Mycobacterium sp.]|nr:hypothetical protein [Mycobacterium sp.]
MVAGPDTTASVSPREGEPFVGLRFHPGVLPRLLGVPASELRNARVAVTDLRPVPLRTRSLLELATDLASDGPRPETAPWSLPQLGHITSRLAAGSVVTEVAREVGWSSRTLQRQCGAVYGYGPATLRRNPPRRPAPTGLPMTWAVPNPDACPRWCPRCRRTTYCHRVAPPLHAVRSTREWPRRAAGRTPAIVARRGRRSAGPSM